MSQTTARLHRVPLSAAAEFLNDLLGKPQHESGSTTISDLAVGQFTQTRRSVDFRWRRTHQGIAWQFAKRMPVVVGEPGKIPKPATQRN